MLIFTTAVGLVEDIESSEMKVLRGMYREAIFS